MGQILVDNHPITVNLLVLGKPDIGMEKDVHDLVIKILNDSLASETVLTQKIRGAYWNNFGSGFDNIHILFNSQFEQLNDIVDEIAVRVRRLGGIPISSFEEFLKASRLKEQPGDIPDINELLADHEGIVHFLHEDATKCSEKYEDEVTRGFLLDIIDQHEKMVSMLRYYIENEPSHSNYLKGNSKHELSTIGS
ncbi:MAG: Dps family protein [Anaerolineaceae bacterium]